MVNEEIEFLEYDISVELSMPLVVHVGTDIAAFADAYNEVVSLLLLPDFQSGLQRHPKYENIVDKINYTTFKKIFFLDLIKTFFTNIFILMHFNKTTIKLA